MQHRPSAQTALALALALVLSGVVAADAARRPRAVKTKLPGERECMARAMYFESNRTRPDGMLAVGTVVANRLASGRYGATVCGVVGATWQFAPGVLSRSMLETRVASKALRVADAVLAGERHPAVADAMFFHTANVPFRHDDKTYVTVSGGNAFYRWNKPDSPAEKRANVLTLARAAAAAEADRETGERIVTAALEPAPPRPQPIAVAAVRPAPNAPVAAEITQGPRDTLVQALAYRSEPPKTAAAAAVLAEVAKLKPSPARRVISPAAPVLAGAGPVGEAAPTPVEAAAAPVRPPLTRADLVVAEAWDAVAGAVGALRSFGRS